jgi:hypothetical protein
MSIENVILLSSTNNESADLVYSDKQKGAGYHRRYDAVHTAVFTFDNFKGSVKLQATLSLYPSDDDWFDIEYDSGLALESVDSTPLLTTELRNFTGNFIWIRAAYQLTEGTITHIRYSY